MKTFLFFPVAYKQKCQEQDCCCIMSWEPRIGFKSADRFILSRKFSPVQASHNNSTFLSCLLLDTVFRFTSVLSGVWQEVVTPHYQVLSCKPSSFSVQVDGVLLNLCFVPASPVGEKMFGLKVVMGKHLYCVFLFSATLHFAGQSGGCWIDPCCRSGEVCIHAIYVFQPAHTLHFVYDSFTNNNTE